MVDFCWCGESRPGFLLKTKARRIAAKLPELLRDHTAPGGTIKHLTFGITDFIVIIDTDMVVPIGGTCCTSMRIIAQDATIT
jgi:hypothetical protein